LGDVTPRLRSKSRDVALAEAIDDQKCLSSDREEAVAKDPPI
jgi:hypothetical protein